MSDQLSTDLNTTLQFQPNQKTLAELAASDQQSEQGDQKPKTLLETSNEIQVRLADPNKDASLFAATTFEEMNVAGELLRGLHAMGFQKPSKIQGRAVPLLLHQPYLNFIGQSQSGTGKTGAFVLACLSRIDTARQQTQAVVLAPTRELAVQILTVVKAMSQFTLITSCAAVKESIGKNQQVSEHVVVGTPGTLQDLLRKRSVVPDGVKMLIIDEADHMLDRQGMGDQTIRIKRMLPQECQIVLFSATYRDDVKMFAEKVVPNANMISLKREELSVDAITQVYLDCKSAHQKYQTLCDIYGLCNIGQSIVFCHKKITADDIAARMQQDGHKCSVLHGGLTAEDRDRVYSAYLSGETKVLITTNVMSRGIDVLEVNLVINYDLPMDQEGSIDYETYLHRIGRTGRFGRRGISINFVHDEKTLAQNQSIEKYFGREIKRIGTDDLVTLEQQLKDALKGR